jgi:hypothetical protein
LLRSTLALEPELEQASVLVPELALQKELELV